MQPSNRFLFTEASVRKYAPPADKADYYVYDTETKGLAIRSQFGNGKTYIIRYRVGEKFRKLRLGDVGAIELAEARKKARQAFAKVEDSIDPVNERARAASAAGHTFDRAVPLFLEDQKADWSESYYKSNSDYLNNAFKALHTMALDSIDRATVARELKAIKRNRGPIAMNRARAGGSAFFSWAIGEGICTGTNPFSGTNKAPQKARDRFLTKRELKLIWNAAPDNQFGDIVKLLILTMQRRDEIGGLPVAEFNREERILEIKGERFKNGKDNHIPLGKKAFELVDKHYDPKRKFLFGAIDTGYSGWSKSKAEMDADLKAINSPWVLHDFRRAGKTVMSEELDVPLEISEAILNHTKKGLEAVYNGAKYIRRKREALDKYNDWVMAAVA